MLFRSNDTATTEIYTPTNTLSLHDALPISHVHFIDALPRNDMGKIQRDVLKKSAASLTAGESRQQRRRSQRLTRKASQGARAGTTKRN